MAPLPSEIYKTIKRSISGSNVFGNHSTTSQSPRFINKWIHPPAALVNGRVEYVLKFLGHEEVSEAKGTHVVRDAIHAIRFKLSVSVTKGIAGYSGTRLPKVVIQISIDGVNILDYKTRITLFKFQLHQISFCADDKRDQRVFSFIVKNDSSRYECFVFLSDKLAEQITLTVGESFDLAYEKFIKVMRNFDDHKKMMFLQRRVYELERENKELRGKNRELVQHLSNYSHGITAPLIPTSPIPPPPPNLQILPSPTNSSLDLISLNEIFTIAQNGESTSNNRDDLFDNNFDPRASSSTSSQKHPAEPNNQDNNSSVQNPKDSSDVDFLSKRMEVFEEQLAAFRAGLALGDTGDSAQDLDGDDGNKEAQSPAPSGRDG